jgi:hypothetical protein
MADDNSRPAYGPSPDQQSSNAPGWWPSLEREDLPDGGAATGESPPGSEHAGEEQSLHGTRAVAPDATGRAWPRLLSAVARIVRRGGR